MNLRNPIASLVFTKVLLLGCAVAPAQESDPIQDLTDGIVEDVIDRTIETARHEVIRNTGNDPLKWGYILSKRYEPVSDGASDETRREL